MLPLARLALRPLAALALAGASLGAQSAGPSGADSAAAPATPVRAAATASAAAAPNSLVPRADAVTAGVRAPRTPPVPSPAPGKGDTSQNRTLMIVGGVAFLVGAIIVGSSHTAGTLFLVGGAVVGLYGLYKYLE